MTTTRPTSSSTSHPDRTGGVYGRITTERQSEGYWIAFLDGNRKLWEVGSTETEALGKMYQSMGASPTESPSATRTLGEVGATIAAYLQTHGVTSYDTASSEAEEVLLGLYDLLQTYSTRRSLEPPPGANAPTTR